MKARAGLSLLPVLCLVACGRPAGEATKPAEIPSAGTAEAQRTVNFANFVAEIGEDTLEAFTRTTGIAVNYDTYESNLALEAKLLVGTSGYDVVVPGNNFLQSQVAAGVYRKLDRALLPNWRNLDPAILAKLELNDPGNQYAVPYLVGSTALGYNVALVEAALGGPAPDSWALLFDPDNAARLADCGISVTDSPWMMTAMALLYLGRDPNSEHPDDLQAAMDMLHGIRPFVRDISNAPITNQLAEGELCLAVAPAADFRLARDLARETGRNVEMHYFIPREGGILWVDMLAIPADAPHPREAHALIDFLMRPEVIAAVTAETYLANANVPGTALVPNAVRSDQAVYPDGAALERLRLNAALSPETLRYLNREFARFRTGP
jgi:putrescine transport system substrate-binding protein